MTTLPSHISLHAAQHDLTSGDPVPEWIHLLPAPKGGVIQSNDRRGPYYVADLQAIADASLADGKIEIDENHSTYLAAPKGEPSPARGWIVEMQARDDGLWGKVEWTDKGRALIEDRAYKAISPALIFDRMLPKKIAKLGNASLVNRPNLREMTSLHQMEFEMDLAARLAKLLGLSDGASDEAIIAAINDKKPSGNTELQSAVNDIGVALGCDAGADTNAILTAARQATPQNEVVALQSQVATLSGELDTLKQEGARKAAEDLVDAGIADCRVGLNAESRDRYINLCMSDMDMGRDLIAGLPKLSGEVLPDTPPAEGGAVSLNAEEIAVADQLGLSHADFAAQRDKEAS